ncbi:unnamed protein product [Anisakis simplex]|uniref:Pyrroline-5-carboxylate reductase n=1 Tax=Anisakis simplex TaxID=6269 RepID=A0A0M3K1V7_ANISI|nr:unnamed protein product [Anisakis simplex]
MVEIFFIVFIGALFRDEIAISVQSQSSVSRWKKLGFENVYTNNNEMLKHHGNGIVFLAIKPQQLDSVMEELSVESLHRTKILVSIMSGINIETLQKHASQKGGQGTRVLRMMPTIPASLGASASAIAAGKSTPQSQVDVVAYLAECVGRSFVIAEKCFDVATAVTGCGTASVFTMIEALADGGVLGGLPRSTALALASQTIMGAAKMALESDEHPAKLRDNVCSPAGITICGVRELERHGARSALIEAVNASTQRSKELSQL